MAGAALMLALASPALAHASPAASPDLAPQAAGIVGGEPSLTCAWPQVLAMQNGGLCTGTLIHPRVVAYAAHCGTFQPTLLLGEDVAAPAREIETLYCERNQDIFAVSSQDYAFCVLAEPVEDIPVTPPLAGCEAELLEVGTPVTIVGFGDITSEDPQQTGTKHEAQTEITGMLSTIGIGGMGTGADSGDSGGPAMVQLEDGSWRLLGIVSGGGGDGGTVQYVPAPLIIAWIEAQSGIDVSPCHRVEGEEDGPGEATWAPTPTCEGFYVATEPGASWEQGCPSARSGPADSCGAPWTELQDEDPPTVDFEYPLDGDVLPGPPVQLSVRALADDGQGSGVASVRLRIEGEPWLDPFEQPAVDEVPPYAFEDVWLEQGGAQVLELEVLDAFGNQASASITVYVGEDPADETGTGTETETGAGSEETGPDGTDGTGGSESGGGCSCSSDEGPLGGRAGVWLWWALLSLAACSRAVGPRRRA